MASLHLVLTISEFGLENYSLQLGHDLKRKLTIEIRKLFHLTRKGKS
jgi:hypothetical protein